MKDATLQRAGLFIWGDSELRQMITTKGISLDFLEDKFAAFSHQEANYIADSEQLPRRISFVNGRTVTLEHSGGVSYLDVDRNESTVTSNTAETLRQAEWFADADWHVYMPPVNRCQTCGVGPREHDPPPSGGVRER